MNLFRVISIAVFLCFFASSVVHADDGGALEVGRLIHQGKLEAAELTLGQALKAQPKNPQLQFMQGVLHMELKNTDAAIAIFMKMTLDFPNFAEPYNNLAVLYAKLGQLEKARAALELAIINMPTYATAHENLAHIYAKLAQENFKKASRFGGGDGSANKTFALIAVKSQQ